MIDASIDSFLNEPVVVDFHEPSHKVAIVVRYEKSSIFGKIVLDKSLIDDRIIQDYHYHKTREMRIGNEKASSSRIGAVLVKSENWDELTNKIKTAGDKIEAFDTDNNPILRKDLISHKQVLPKNI